MQKIFVNLLIALLLFTPKLFAEEGSTYQFGWLDKDKEVYVLQNREYKKVHTINFNVAYGMSLSEAFVDETVIQGRLGYYFWESWGLEILYSKNDGKTNETYSGVTGSWGGAGSRPYYQIIENYTGIILNWSPFYSKINLFNAIVYLDWTFGLGGVSITQKNNAEYIANPLGATDTLVSETDTGILFQTSWIFYLNQAFSIRADIIGLFYKANTPSPGSVSKQNSSQWDAVLGVGFRF